MDSILNDIEYEVKAKNDYEYWIGKWEKFYEADTKSSSNY